MFFNVKIQSPMACLKLSFPPMRFGLKHVGGLSLPPPCVCTQFQLKSDPSGCDLQQCAGAYISSPELHPATHCNSEPPDLQKTL